MTSIPSEQTDSLSDVSMPFEQVLNEAFFSEFVDFGTEDGAFSETLLHLSGPVLNPPIGFNNAANACGFETSVAGADWPCERQQTMEPATVTLPQLNLEIMGKSYHTQLDFCARSQQPPVYPVPHRHPRDKSPEQQQRMLPELAPRETRVGVDLQHPSDDTTQKKAKTAKRRTKFYPEEDITCRHCNIKTETPGELR